MHELSITESILQTVLSGARASGAAKVVRINLVVGELNDFRQQWIQRYFDYLSRDTPAQGAVIAVEKVPAALRCEMCDCEFDSSLCTVDRVCCPDCSSTRLALIRGTEFLVRDIEVE